MTEKQPEALLLADVLQFNLPSATGLRQAAAELRRLHALNSELLDALKESLELVEREVSVADSLFMPVTQHTRGDGKPGRVFIGKWYGIDKWRDAIAKATEVQP